MNQSAPSRYFEANQLYARLYLNQTFGPDSPSIARLLEYRNDAPNLAGLSDFLFGEFEPESSDTAAREQERKEALEKALSDKLPAQYLSGSRLQSVVGLNRLFADRPEALKRIFDAEHNGTDYLDDLLGLNQTKIGRAVLEKFISGSDSIERLQPSSWALPGRT